MHVAWKFYWTWMNGMRDLSSTFQNAPWQVLQGTKTELRNSHGFPFRSGSGWFLTVEGELKLRSTLGAFSAPFGWGWPWNHWKFSPRVVVLPSWPSCVNKNSKNFQIQGLGFGVMAKEFSASLPLWWKHALVDVGSSTELKISKRMSNELIVWSQYVGLHRSTVPGMYSTYRVTEDSLSKVGTVLYIGTGTVPTTRCSECTGQLKVVSRLTN